MTCDSVQYGRDVYELSESDGYFITYTTAYQESSALRCCLAHEEWIENKQACTSQSDETRVYTWDTLNGGSCTYASCTTTNYYLPGTSSRDPIWVTGDEACVPAGMNAATASDCCEAGVGGCDDEVSEPEYTEGTCLENDCSRCQLSFYPATSYYVSSVLQRRVVDYDNFMDKQTIED